LSDRTCNSPAEYIAAARNGNEKYKWIHDLIETRTDSELDDALKEFIHRAEQDYYSECFWFRLQRDVWVNTWNNDGGAADAKTVPNDFQAFMEWLEEWIAQEITSSWFWRLLPGALSQMTNVKASTPSSIAITHYNANCRGK
jgi:hypothetical protein